MQTLATPGYMPYLMVAAVVFAIYRRVRSSFGRQPWRPKRTKARVVILALVMALISMAAFAGVAMALGVAGGALAGIALGAVSLRLMRIDLHTQPPSYVPNPWIGAALTALLFGRIVFRYGSGGFTNAPQHASPLTIAIAAMVVSFYLVQGVGLMRRMRHAPVASAA